MIEAFSDAIISIEHHRQYTSQIQTEDLKNRYTGIIVMYKVGLLTCSLFKII